MGVGGFWETHGPSLEGLTLSTMQRSPTTGSAKGSEHQTVLLGSWSLLRRKWGGGEQHESGEARRGPHLGTAVSWLGVYLIVSGEKEQ